MIKILAPIAGVLFVSLVLYRFEHLLPSRSEARSALGLKEVEPKAERPVSRPVAESRTPLHLLGEVVAPLAHKGRHR